MERDPHEAIRQAENALRDLIEETLSKAFATDWLLASGLSPERIVRLRERKGEEQKRRPLQKPEERLLYYADLTDLITIVGKQWPHLSPFLLDKKETEVYLARLEDLRNPDAHQRGLFPYEVDLVFGISGHFRQALALMRSAVDTLDKYYPRFESIVDNFGHAAKHPDIFMTRTETAIRAGDILVFKVSAWSPDDELLEFKVGFGYPAFKDVLPWTTDTTLTVVVAEEHIDRSVYYAIHVRGKRKKENNPHGADDVGWFNYIGIPTL